MQKYIIIINFYKLSLYSLHIFFPIISKFAARSLNDDGYNR